MHPEGCTVSSSSDDNNYSRTFAKPKEIIKVIVLLSWLRQGNLDLGEKPGVDYFKAYFDGSVRLCHPPSQHKLNGATYYTNYKSLMNLADARSITKLTVRYKTYWMEKFVSLMSKKVVKQHSRLDFSHFAVQRLIDPLAGTGRNWVPVVLFSADVCHFTSHTHTDTDTHI